MGLPKKLLGGVKCSYTNCLKDFQELFKIKQFLFPNEHFYIWLVGKFLFLTITLIILKMNGWSKPNKLDIHLKKKNASFWDSSHLRNDLRVFHKCTKYVITSIFLLRFTNKNTKLADIYTSLTSKIINKNFQNRFHMKLDFVHFVQKQNAQHTFTLYTV